MERHVGRARTSPTRSPCRCAPGRLAGHQGVELLLLQRTVHRDGRAGAGRLVEPDHGGQHGGGLVQADRVPARTTGSCSPGRRSAATGRVHQSAVDATARGRLDHRLPDVQRSGDMGTPQAFQQAASNINYTFNWFYVNNAHTAYYNSGWNPVRPANVDPNLPIQAASRTSGRTGTRRPTRPTTRRPRRIRTRSTRTTTSPGTTSRRWTTRRPASATAASTDPTCWTAG